MATLKEPRRQLPRLIIIILLALPLCACYSDQYGPVVTIESQPGFADMRSCAQWCLWNIRGEDLRAYIGCPSPNGYGRDVCFCRDDLKPSAYSYISQCVTGGCQANTVDLNGAVSFYDNYCANIGPTGEVEGGINPTPSANPATSTVIITRTEREPTTSMQLIATVTSIVSIISTIPDDSTTRETATTGPVYTQTILVQTVTAMPTSTKSTGLDSASKIALGVSLGIGLPLVGAVILLGILLVRHQRYSRRPRQVVVDTQGDEKTPKYRPQYPGVN